MDLANGTLLNGTVVSGVTTPTLTLANISPSDVSSGALFNVGVTNSAGGAESQTASITIVDPAISVQPEPVIVGAGSNALFSAVAQGTGVSNYQWNKGGTPISNSDPHYSGVNSASLIVLVVSDADEGGYNVTVSNGGPNSPANSDTVSLTVINPPGDRIAAKQHYQHRWDDRSVHGNCRGRYAGLSAAEEWLEPIG